MELAALERPAYRSVPGQPGDIRQTTWAIWSVAAVRLLVLLIEWDSFSPCLFSSGHSHLTRGVGNRLRMVERGSNVQGLQECPELYAGRHSRSYPEMVCPLFGC